MIKIIFFKEMLDTLRDRRTLVATVGIPLLLYPAVFIFGSQVVIVQQSAMESRAAKVAIDESIAPLADWLAEDEDIEVVEVDDGEAALNAGDVGAYVTADEGGYETIENGGSLSLTVKFDSTEPSSQLASRRVQDRLNDRAEALLDTRLEDIKLDRAFIEPIVVARDNVATAEKTGGTLVGAILPLLMVVMLGVGAFYPAVDITAGEKERGTFETLLSTPARKLDIVWGKFLAVFLISLVTGALNIGSMTATFALQAAQLADRIGELDISISLAPLAIISLAMIPLAFFISAAMMAIAVLARSFKEAQNFVTPFFIVIILPATLAVLPGSELTRGYYLMPIGNVVMLFKELLVSPVPLEAVFAIIASTVVYAAGALFIAAKLFQSEEILLAEDRGLSFSISRKDIEPRDAPSPGVALGLFAIVMLLIFYVGSYAQTKDLLWGLVATQYLVILAPVLAALWYLRVDLKSGLMLRWPGIPNVIANIIFGCGWVVIAFQFGSWLQRIFPMPEAVQEGFEQIAMSFATEWSLAVVILVVAVSPAICEEALFRGALLSSLRKTMPAWAGILLIGVLFGLFHMSIYRIVPTGITGIALTYAAWRSRSILAGCIMHFINNATLILISRPEVGTHLERYVDPKTIETQGLPWSWVAFGAVLAVIGIIAIERTAPKKEF